MELIVFDLDGTLLDHKGRISALTRDTLADLSRLGVAYTVATGRTLHASRQLLHEHNFGLPHIYKNGVMIWDPATDDILHNSYLRHSEVSNVIDAITGVGLAAFVFALGSANTHLVFHTPPQTTIEQQLLTQLVDREALFVTDIRAMPKGADITNISALGEPELIWRIRTMIGDQEHLVAYSGNAWDGDSWKWLDIHHSSASKGGAIDILREHLEIDRVVCFGDSENDLSMFDRADESYAPSNADERVRHAATSTIGGHDEDGIARFLRQRFGLDA